MLASNTYQFAGNLNVSCTSAGDYVVVLRDVAYPRLNTKDNDLTSNVSTIGLNEDNLSDPPAPFWILKSSRTSPTSRLSPGLIPPIAWQ